MTREELIKRYAAGERDFQGLNFGKVDLHSVNLSGVNLSDALMHYVNLRGAVLEGANLAGADLHWARLDGTNLHKADLHRVRLNYANLYRANFSETNLRGASLCWTTLRGTDLRKAFLCGSDLRNASLLDADLRGAHLERTKLADCYFTNADLRETCLSDNPGCPPSDLFEKNWDVRGGYVYGWRTDRSVHVGDTRYKSGQIYTAPILSCSKETECHPGIYMMRNKEDVVRMTANTTKKTCAIQVRARCEDVVLLDAWQTKGIRTRRLEVL